MKQRHCTTKSCTMRVSDSQGFIRGSCRPFCIAKSASRSRSVHVVPHLLSLCPSLLHGTRRLELIVFLCPLCLLSQPAGVEVIEYRVVRQGRGCVHIEGVSGGVVRTAAALVALHLKNQLELAESLERAKRAEEDLEAAEEEFSLGLRCEFPIDPEVMGLAIGKNGANIQRALETGAGPFVSLWLSLVAVDTRVAHQQLTCQP